MNHQPGRPIRAVRAGKTKRALPPQEGSATFHLRILTAKKPAGKLRLLAHAIKRREPVTYMVGVAQHPETELYQPWISISGMDVTFVSAHKKEEDAQAVLKVLERAYMDGELVSIGGVQRLLDLFYQSGDASPEPLPSDSLMKLVESIQSFMGHVGEEGQDGADRGTPAIDA